MTTSDDAVKDLDTLARHKLMEACLGRIFKLGSRPTQPGDVAEYERCRALFVACAEAEGLAR